MVDVFTIDSGAALGRAIASIGRRFTPQGRCLEHNAIWQLNGRTSVFGQEGRVASIAMNGWDWEPDQNRVHWHPGMVLGSELNGLLFYFGPSPTRTDANAAAGDVTTIYNGKLICTDASGAVVGIMSVEQRAVQTRRPALGFTKTTLGTPTTAGAHLSPAPAPAPAPAPRRTDDDEMISADAQAWLNGLGTTIINQVKVAVRREGRARLYFDAGPTGKEFTETTAVRAVAAKVTDGFLYPLNPDPQARVGQVNSLRNTHYLLIDAAETFEGLPTGQFNNMIEMANGHLRRLAAAVAEGADGVAVTPTHTLGDALPTRALS